MLEFLLIANLEYPNPAKVPPRNMVYIEGGYEATLQGIRDDPVDEEGLAFGPTRGHGHGTTLTLTEQLRLGGKHLDPDNLPSVKGGFDVPARIVPYAVARGTSPLNVVRHGLENGVRIFSASFSWGDEVKSEIFYRQVDQMIAPYGAIFVGEAGDWSVDSGGAQIIKVTSSKHAQYGPGVEFVVPGDRARSSAIPTIAGQLGALWALMPNASADELIAFAAEHSTKPSGAEAVRYGALDFYAALEAATQQ